MRTQLIWTCLAVGLGLAGGWGGFHWFSTLPLREADSAFRAGNYVQAMASAEGWLVEHPADQRAMLIAARCYAHLGRWEEAEAYFAQVTLTELDDLHLRGRGLVVRELHDEAAVVFSETLKRYPMDGESLQRLAAIRGQQLRMHEALSFARQLCQVPSHQVVGHVLLGMLEIQFRDPAHAVESLETALRLSPELEGAPADVPTVLTQLAEAHFHLGRPADAERHALRARERSTNPEPCWILGRVCEQRGDVEGARKYWEEAVARDPHFAPAMRELGRLALLEQKPNVALSWLLRAYEAKPDDTATAQALATTYQQLGQEDAARRILEDLEKSGRR